MLVVADAMELAPLKEIKQLSIGAGDTKWKESAGSMVNPCVAKAGLNTIKIVFSAGESADIYKANRILQGRHYRISPDLGNGFDIDDASEKTLKALELAAKDASKCNLETLQIISA
jgi:hypothetical protein